MCMDPKKQLDMLLRVIHRDGGKFQQVHGTDEAYRVACLIVDRMVLELHDTHLKVNLLQQQLEQRSEHEQRR